MKIKLKNNLVEFEVISLNVFERNIENIFNANKKSLKYVLDKAAKNKKNRLNKIAVSHLSKYSDKLNLNLGEFLYQLKKDNNPDYKFYLNKYGDEKYCYFRIDKFLNDKGIYCYIVDNEIKYVGRCKKTFKERFNEYGKITPYNCLIDGQATNCNINSKINNLDSVMVGIFSMTNNSDEDIIKMEKNILLENRFEWNIQKI